MVAVEVHEHDMLNGFAKVGFQQDDEERDQAASKIPYVVLVDCF